MKRLVIESWLLLIYIERILHFRSFSDLHRMVQEAPVSQIGNHSMISSEKLCRAVDCACVFYFKEVLCLQRSSATALLFRKHGRRAEMVIGAQLLPFRSHAWVEIDGAVVNDKPYMNEIYQVLDRC